jgi:hypothetical protein
MTGGIVSSEVLVHVSQTMLHHTQQDTNPHTAVHINHATWFASGCTLKQVIKFIIIILPHDHDCYKKDRIMLN